MSSSASQPDPRQNASRSTDASRRDGSRTVAAETTDSPTTENRSEGREALLRDSLLITQIDGMHAHTCEERIVRSVSELPGVKEVEVDFPSGQASVIFDARKVSVHQLIEAVEKVGYRCAEYALGSGGGLVE